MKPTTKKETNTMTNTTYTICFYRNGELVQEIDRADRMSAELVAMDGFKAGCEVSIYISNGKTLKGWNKRMA
jgi:hypothetical protein